MEPQANIVDADIQSFAAEVIEASREQLVMVDFWADWCGPCKSLTPILEKLVAQYQGAVRLVKVDTEANQEMAAQFGIRSLPTVFFFKDGNPVDQFMGLQPEEAIRQIIDRHTGNPGESELAAAEAAYDQGQKEEAKAFIMQLIHADPTNDAPKLLMLKWLCAEGNMDDARTVAEAVSEDGHDSAEYKAWQTSVEMQEALKDLPSESELMDIIASDEGNLDARLQLAQRHIALQQPEQGLDQLLEIVRRDRSHDDEAARKMMIKVFESLGGSGPLVSKYRGLLARTLN